MQFSLKISRICLIAGIVISCSAHSQITLTGNDYLSKPAGVITDMLKVEGITSPGDISGVSANNKVRTYKYLDGFGRALQGIVEGGSPNGKDLIQLSVYDEFGRSTKQYLPFEYTSVTSGQPYQDRSTALSNQASFYTTNTSANKIPYDTKPWVQSGIEESPMQRLLKQGDVGDGFQTDQHYKSVVYRVIDGNDASVRKWAADGTSSGSYSANDLSVTEGIDEDGASNGAVTLVFTDKFGRTVLKRQKADQTIGGNNYTYFETYYVYDLLGNVSYVIPPKAVVKLTSVGGTWNVTSVPDLIFSYKYDKKNRVIERKVPGAEVVYMVYDPLDRVVLVQSGTMRANDAWFYSKYDGNGRVVTEGVYTDATYTTFNDGTSTDIQLYVNGLSCYGSSSTTYYEEKTTSTSSFYTNNCFPTSGTEERLYYYYDDYDMNGDGTQDYSYASQSLPGEGTATDKTAGLPTMVNKKVPGSSTWLPGMTFYDKHYNIIQSVQYGPITWLWCTVTNVVDFGGRLNESKTYYRFTKFTDLSIRNSYSYDKMNRLTELKQGHNGGTMIIVGHYEYNSLGQLVDKKLHSTNSGSSYLQSVDFRYNIRGQITSINNSGLSSDGGTTNDESNDLWGMNLFYEKEDNASDVVIGNTPNWTGMLSAVKWKASISLGNNDERAYLFSYDKLYRLSAATYKANTGSAWTKDANGYNETPTYDWNGNILTMKRKAVISGSVTDIDDMAYDYGSSNDNNKLVNMAESSSNSHGYINFTSSSSGYSYDANGNLTADAKKGTTITYNELNKPKKIEQTSTGKYVEFGYDAAGVRISKSVYNGSTTTTEYYIAGAVVQSNGTLKYFAMAEGRVRNNSGTLVYEYFITDQLGNTRLSFEDNGSGTAVARQENSYYPFGMPMAGNYMPSDANKKLYNAGSEWQDEFGGIIDYYSTFFREYDPVIGRFNAVDPKAEMTVELSIYHYSGNNPVNFNDPMGDWFTDGPAGFGANRNLGGHGGGWSPDYGFFTTQEEMWNDLDRLYESDYGGRWNPKGGAESFNSNEEALAAGNAYMDYHNAWNDGTNSQRTNWATSKENAVARYIKAQFSVFECADKYKDWDKTKSIDLYNCAGFSFRDYNWYGLEQALIHLNANKKSVGVKGDIKYWVWIFHFKEVDRNGKDIRPGNVLGKIDYHVVSGPLGENGADPVAVYSKNGYGYVLGPQPPLSWAPVSGLNILSRPGLPMVPVYVQIVSITLFTFVLPCK